MVIVPQFILQSILPLIFFCCVFFTLYKKHISSFFDPLTYFVFNLATASVLILQEGITSDWTNIFQFFLFQLFFWLGFTRIKVDFTKKVSLFYTMNDIILLEYLTFTLFVVYLIANLYFFATVGAPIFANDPTIAKVDSYTGGLGFVRRINWGVANFISCAALVLSLVGRYKRSFFVILLIQIIFSATSGSKGGTFLSFIFLIALLSERNEFKDIPQLLKYKKLIKYLFASGVVVGTIVLFAKYGDINKSLFALLHRIMMAGDAIIYYYNPAVFDSFRSYGLWDFILHEANPILGFFRLADYEYPLGYQMVVKYLATYGYEELATVLGPNAPFYVEGHIYFGPVAGLGYSFLMGYLVSYVRKQYFNTNNKNLVSFVFLFNLTSLILTIPQDTTFFTIQFFDSMFLTVIVFVFYIIAFSSIRKNVVNFLTPASNKKSSMIRWLVSKSGYP